MQYDRSAIQRWLSKHDTSPKVGDSLSVTWEQLQILRLFSSHIYMLYIYVYVHEFSGETDRGAAYAQNSGRESQLEAINW